MPVPGSVKFGVRNSASSGEWRKLYWSTVCPLRLYALAAPVSNRPSILAAAESRRRMCRSARILRPGGLLRLLALLVLLLAPLPNRARPAALRIPFRTVDSMILVEGKVNGNRVTFLLDTGANKTIVSVKTYGHVPFALQSARHNDLGPGMKGDAVRLSADVELANHMWVGQRVSVMNLDELTKVLGLRFDGLLGQDLLREFRSVRIDYKAHVIELEE
jgi:hypothetical protein